jgi:hypothetical protein
LLIYHQLSTGHSNLWVLGPYAAFLVFVGLRARKLKKRVAELVDVAALRTGLLYLGRTGASGQPTKASTVATAEAQ